MRDKYLTIFLLYNVSNLKYFILLSALLTLLVNCLWNDYSAWTECNKDCGGGTKHRTRTVYQEAKFGGEPCEGDAKEEVACNENPCAGTAFFDTYFDNYYPF